MPFSGTTLVANNGLYRDGGVFWNEAQEFGAITLFPSTKDITGVTIRDTDIYDSTYDGIQFKNGGGNMPNVAITNVKIDKSNNGAGILAMSGARGNANLTNVTITNSNDPPLVERAAGAPAEPLVCNPAAGTPIAVGGGLALREVVDPDATHIVVGSDRLPRFGRPCRSRGERPSDSNRA